MIHKLMKLKICQGKGKRFEYVEDDLFFVDENGDFYQVSVEEAHTVIDFFAEFVKSKKEE